MLDLLTHKIIWIPGAVVPIAALGAFALYSVSRGM
jgi:hypothetical protein